MKDKQGILRGRCTVCNCTEYITPKDKLRCRTCNHVPAKHEDVGQIGQIHDVNDSLCSNYEDEVDWESVVSLESAGQFNFRSANVVEAWSGPGGDDLSGTSAESSSFLYCHIPGCNDVASFDLNTRQYTSVYCYNHLSTAPVTNAVSNVPSVPHLQPNMMATNSGQSPVHNVSQNAQLNVFYR